MDPTTRYELRPGEWRPDPPCVSYGCDRSGLVALLNKELSARAWSQGESIAGPSLEVRGRTIACPLADEDLKWLVGHAASAPYGRGEETLIDPKVRDALQIAAEDVVLGTGAWDELRSAILRKVAVDMGLEDAPLRLEPLKLLIYTLGGHFAQHADTEKNEGMVASLSLIAPGEYEGGALVVEHDGERISLGGGLALATECVRGGASIESVMALWEEAVTTDGGGPEPKAHRLLLNALRSSEVLHEAERLETRIAENEWFRRRRAMMTRDA